MAITGKLCLFCHRSVAVEVAGEILSEGEVVVHQHCLYFASGLPQNGTGHLNTINGFLIRDIRKELRRGLKIRCSGCREPGGFVGCAVRICKKSGHFPCLYRLGYTFQYSGEFRVYCPEHCPTQPKLQGRNSPECCICLAHFTSQDIIYCPCCLTVFHKTCVQKQAWSAGSHHMRCAVCKNTETYCAEMLRMGIDIPDRDAQWEVGMDYASEESKYCHAALCLCPEGRSHSPQIGQYRMRKCRTCGQCRGHVECLRGDETNECQDCYATSGMGGEPSMAASTAVREPSTGVKGAEASSMEVSMTGKAPSTSTAAAAAQAPQHKVLVLSLKKLNAKDILLINTHK